MKEKIKLTFMNIDYIIVIVMTILIGIGMYCEHQAFILDEGQRAIFIKLIAGILIGYIMIISIIFIDHRFICSLSWFLYLMMTSVLAFTLIFGNNKNNVKRWVDIFGIPFQPSELTKVVLILFLAYLCNRFKNKLDKLYVLIILTAVVAVPVVLILLEPHLSSSLAILFIFCIIVYSSGISYKLIGAAFAVIIPVVATVLIGVAVFDLKIPFIEGYQVNRVLNFISSDESEDLAGDYQQNQSIGAIGSGGLHGKLIDSDVTQEKDYSMIYAKESDFVFAIVGEDFGFIGSFLIILLYAILIIRCILISIGASDYMGRLIGMGVSAYLMFQIFVNIGVATNLLPNTGLPLPFISYGLTSLISSMIAVGLVLNIGVRQRIKNSGVNVNSKAFARG